MSEIKINFQYNCNKISIQCKNEDRMNDVIEKLKMKIDIEIDKIYLLYNGQKINVEMIIEDIINNADKNKNEMNIIVYDIDNTIINENIKQSEDIICPECKKNTLIKIEDYKIRKYNCKNKHNNLILLKEYENTQNIDISQIKCEICKIKNKSNTYNNEIYKLMIFYVHYVNQHMIKIIK